VNLQGLEEVVGLDCSSQLVLFLMLVKVWVSKRQNQCISPQVLFISIPAHPSNQALLALSL
jgi:hypothetical protein